MGQKARIMYAIILALGIGIVTSVSTVFAVESNDNTSNAFSMIFAFFQEIKSGLITDGVSSLSPSESNSAALIGQLKNEVDELKSRINSLEEPAKVYSTELYPITDIDCSDRNMIEAFLSGWCPHQSRNIYFIEDARVKDNSIVAISLEQKNGDKLDDQTICGVIDQDLFNFSFYDEKTGKAKLLENLHGFVMKCDQSPIDNKSILKYTIINT
ncbi:MAG: hypothetical protein ACE5RN_05310 [Nitrosopumilaceae archaeon]